MKRYLFILIIVATCFLGYFLYQVSTFDLFSVEEKLLISFKDYSGMHYNVFFVAGNATAQDVIQVRKIVEGSVPEVIANIEAYNAVESSKLLNDSLFQLVLNDVGYADNLPDTVVLNLRSKVIQ